MKRPFPRIASVLLALVGLASPATAQKPATAPPPKAAAPPAPTAAPISPSHAAAVQDLFGAMKLKTELQRLPDAMINSEISRNPGLAPFRDVMVNWLKKYLTWDAMAPHLTKLYAETFSEVELKEMAAFYRTPTGQKAMAKMPELTQRSAMIGAQLGQAHSEELKKLMDARQEQLAKQQEKTTPGAAPKAGARPPAAKQPTAAPKKP
jgi:hypothetical protein